MKDQKTSIMIYHVPEEEMKSEGKGERMCRGALSPNNQPRSGIKFTHYNIMCSRGFLCEKFN